MLILNLKTYPEATADNLDLILKAVEHVINKYPQLKEEIYVAPAITEVWYAKKYFPEINIISQHAHALDSGKTTGKIAAGVLFGYGINFTLLNHSEYRFQNKDELLSEIEKLQVSGIKVVVCCEDLDEARTLLKAKPYAIAFEDKELIGSGHSITSYQTAAVAEFVDLVKPVSKAFIGAGISRREDISEAIKLGADGYIVSSAFVKAENHEEFLKDLVTPLVSH